MEFRYRAIDTDRPRPVTDTSPTQFLNLNSSFLPERSLPVPGTTSELFQSHEEIQREIEKEKIRQEIIIAEATRKRELIAEVLQEMAIEREMAVRGVAETGMSLEEKLTMLINQKKFTQSENQNQNNLLSSQKSINTGPCRLPLMQLSQLQQTPEANGRFIMESNNEKMIVLERADAVGTKRKAEDNQTGLNEDLQEKRHKAKESASKAKSISTTGSSKPSCLGKLGNGKEVESKPRRMNFKFWCEFCKVGAFSEIVMRNHELGKKHKAAITKQQQNEPVETVVSASLAAGETGSKIEGDDETEKKVKFWCGICNIWTNSEQVLKNHKLGKKHKALFEKQQRKSQVVLDTNLIAVPVRSSSTDSGDKGSVDLTKGKVHCSSDKSC